jgi:hypothetical protein
MGTLMMIGIVAKSGTLMLDAMGERLINRRHFARGAAQIRDAVALIQIDAS